MDLLPVLGLIISALVAIWGIYQTYVTKSLEQKLSDSAGICGHGVQPDMEVEMSKLCSQFWW